MGLTWLRTLEGEDPLVVLDRLVPGDPLELGRRCSSWLCAEALLLDPQRLLHAVLTQIAGEVSLGDLPESDAGWVDERIARATKRLLQRDAEAERNGRDELDEEESHGYLSDCFGVMPGDELRASVCFNALPARTRHTFFEVVVEDKSARAVARRRGRDVESIVHETWEGMLALGLVLEVDKDYVVGELLGADGQVDGQEGGWQ